MKIRKYESHVQITFLQLFGPSFQIKDALDVWYKTSKVDKFYKFVIEN